MKIIEGLKRIKELDIKAEDLRSKVTKYCADLDNETPMYENQKDQIKQWIQAHHDIVKEILKLKVSIQKTNLATTVQIDLDGTGKPVEHSIAEWVLRRRELASKELTLWQNIGDRNLHEGIVFTSTQEKKEVKIRRYYDPKERDVKIDLYRNEPMRIDAVLETVNAITDLVE